MGDGRRNPSTTGLGALVALASAAATVVGWAAIARREAGSGELAETPRLPPIPALELPAEGDAIRVAQRPRPRPAPVAVTRSSR